MGESEGRWEREQRGGRASEGVGEETDVIAPLPQGVDSVPDATNRSILPALLQIRFQLHIQFQS